MKYLLYLCIFLCFVFIGMYIYRGYRMRKLFFESLLAFCNHLLIEISFSKNTVLHVIDTYSSAYSSQFIDVLTAYKGVILNKGDVTRQTIGSFMWKGLKAHERGTVTDFFYELGRHGALEEEQKIRTKQIQFEGFYNTSEKSLKSEASIYLKICILLGIGVVVLLI